MAFINGLTLFDKLLPEEILSEIFSRADSETLVECQLVCKLWLRIIQKKNFGKNLIKHAANYLSVWDLHRVEDEGYTISNTWRMELSLVNTPPYPEDPVIEKFKMCYIPCHYKCWKRQAINLIEEGFAKKVLDELQPPIKVREWYTCESGYSPPEWTEYTCEVELILEPRKVITKHFRDKFCNNQNKWFKLERTIRNYGKGLRRINFFHEITFDNNNRCRLAGTYLAIELPGN